MSKRGAGNYLTDQNWDQEDEPEEAGEFVPADESKLKGRKIVRAIRRTNVSAGETPKSSGLFKNFTGFAKTAATDETKSAAAPSFNFGVSTGKTLGGLSDKPLGSTKPMGDLKPSGFTGFSNGSGKTSPAKSTSPTKLSPSTPHSLSNGMKDKTKGSYLQKLRSLNEGVSRWIKEHVDKDPHCILTPIFEDYAKHLSTIEKEKQDNGHLSASNEKNKQPLTSTPLPKSTDSEKTSGQAAPAPKLAFSGFTAPKSEEKPTGAKGGFASIFSAGASSFGSGTSSTGSVFGNDGTAPAFGSTSSTGTEEKKPFSFTGLTAPKPAEPSTSQGQADDEEYVPPKPEVTAVVEEDAFYTKRCKMFYQKSGSWVEKGVGNLHLKKCDNKTQLLIRADTNLGNILLNIMLTKSMPTRRQGKNNVTMVCIPNPPIDPKIEEKTPVNMLIRVKTEADADELLKIIDEKKS